MRLRSVLLTMAVMMVSLWMVASVATAETWTGTISDSSCGRSHDAMTEHGTKGTAKDCTLMCVRGGATFVFVVGDKVLKIANQDFKSLEQFAGDEVELTGSLKGDTITITRIAKAK